MKLTGIKSRRLRPICVFLIASLLIACSSEEPSIEEEKRVEDPEKPIKEKDGPRGENPRDTITDSNDKYEFTTYNFRHQLTDSVIPYSYFEPEQARNGTEKFPLVVALHGLEYFVSPSNLFLKAEERTAYMALAWLEKRNQDKYPAFVVAPNLHRDIADRIHGDEAYFGWERPASADFVEKLIDSILENNQNIDRKRVYLTGHSMGGIGAWYLGSTLKDTFAAIVPLSSAFGNDDETYLFVASKIERMELQDLPVWSFIHRADANAGGGASRAAFKAMSENGYETVYTHRKGDIDQYLTREEIFEEINAGKIHFYTEYSYPCTSVGDCHFAQEVALREDFLFTWLFKQRKN